MRHLTLAITLAFILACGGAATPTGPLADMAVRFDTIDCSSGSTDPDRSWCPVANAGHGPFTLPATTQTRFGLSLALKPGVDPRDAVLDYTSLSALFIGPDGAKLLAITPDDEEEMMELVGVVMSIASTLKGVDFSSVLAKPELIGFLGTLSTGLHPLSFDENGATFTGDGGPTFVQRIEGKPWGAAYVVVEQVPDGDFVSVFPDSDITPLPE